MQNEIADVNEHRSGRTANPVGAFDTKLRDGSRTACGARQTHVPTSAADNGFSSFAHSLRAVASR